MARSPRFDLPGYAQHVVQRGVDRMVCFARHWDYQRYLDELRSSAEKFDCAVHAYVLMTNHVHLLVTPAAAGAVSRMMQRLGRRYVGYFNTCHVRTGHLWEGRYKSCLVQSDGHVLACQRYIDLNPVRAGMVTSPAGYPWSSFRHYACGEPADWLTPHPSVLALHTEHGRRGETYARIVDAGIGVDELDAIRLHLRQGRPWGNARFREQIEGLLGRHAATRPRGRPSHRE